MTVELSHMVIREIVQVAIATYSPGGQTYMNQRPWPGLAFSLEGELKYCPPSAEPVELTANRVVLLPQESSYAVKCAKGGSFAVVNFRPAGEEVPLAFETFDTQSIEPFRQCFMRLHTAFKAGYKRAPHESFSYFYKLLSLLEVDAAAAQWPPVLLQAQAYVEQQLASPLLDNSAIAEAVGISEVYLRKLFTRCLSVSVNRYIRDRRLTKAKLLLEETALPMSEIAARCGYTNPYYFSKLFKGQVGCSPTQYRKQGASRWL